ncbi:MAG: hypothetical protein EXQ58_04450 [Acidobacteria bacterium]|nr:hypothetical protein [Acidobacteriota bacterium]
MSESRQIVFSFKEIAEELVKKEDVREGHWGIFVKFGIHGANLGPTESGLFPTAVVPILELGIQKFDKPNNLTVNAAKVNPIKGFIATKSKRVRRNKKMPPAAKER